MDGAAALVAPLRTLAPRLAPGATDVSRPERLSGGASQETWAFDAIAKGERVPLILRRAPGGGFEREIAAGLAIEAMVIGAAAKAGVPVAPVRHILAPRDKLGQGFVSDRIVGETIARKLLRDAAYAAVRPHLASGLGTILARIHAVPIAMLPPLATLGPAETLAHLRRELDLCDLPGPVFELAFRWLADRRPDEVAPRLVHGDFRNGNLMITSDGVRAVLDWELVHLGDPMEDLGWFCAMPWRFGAVDAPAGGFGSRSAFYGAYAEASGEAIDPERARWWETLASLRWGLNCRSYVALFRSGQDRSVERAMIARRASENEIDLLRLMEFGP